MDSSVATGVRFKLLAEDLGIPRTQVIGCCFLLWLECYERRSDTLSVRLADASAELSGFSEALVKAELAHFDPDGDVVIHGVTERIAFLRKQAERGAKGGKSKGNGRQANAKHSRKQTLSTRLDSGLANTPTPSLTPDQNSSNEQSSLDSLPREALRLADWLRKHILQANPQHKTGKAQNSDTKWDTSATRLKWAQEADRMHRVDGRDYRRSAELIVWLCGPNRESEVSFVVESMKALRDKWDRVNEAEKKARRAA